jgi:hypothetical protein
MHEMVMRLDDIGKPAWIAVMVAGFILFWPVGLAILFYLLWSGRMGCGWNGDRRHWQSRMAETWGWRGPHERWSTGVRAGAPSGNRAFDEYREETLKRLEEESREFQGFLERLRLAKDRSEFDQFMAERKVRPAEGGEGTSEQPKA